MNIRAKLPVQSAGRPEKIALSAVPSVAAPLQQPNSIIKRVFITCTPGQRQAMISEAAYFEAQYRGFESGHELDDWLLAESQIDAAIASGELPHVFKL